MASEIPSAGGLLKRPAFFRNSSSLGPSQRRTGPETLMMGFANVIGSFVLDGSLVNQAPFEDVKRRAVVGGQGAGGVVGIDQRKGQGSFWGGFGWSSISDSLSIGSLLGGNEQSTIREMKNSAGSNSIPLLSTPKSILFVDLRLAPGESRSYSYSFALPRGLPPSHKGRAMKVTYNLVIGTQRPGNSRSRNASDQQIREVEIPFRVFGGVDARGEILGHDLMAPYIILRDQARSSPLELDAHGKPTRPSPSSNKQISAPNSSEVDFNAYASKLLSSPRRNSSSGLISPTAVISPDFQSPSSASPNGTHSRQPSAFQLPPPPPTRVLVDSAIRLSTQPFPQRSSETPSTSQTNFTIARAGRPVATLILSRPALRLGDLLNLTLDFTTASSTSSPRPLVHAIALTLEFTETVEPALALRSTASIDRATRRVWDRRVVGGSGGSALAWCKRWSGALKVPSAATPSFGTTGVGGRWVVRVELVVGVHRRPSINALGIAGAGTEDEESEADDHQGEGAAMRRKELDASPGTSESERPAPSPSPSRAPSLRRTGSLRRQASSGGRETVARTASVGRRRRSLRRKATEPKVEDVDAEETGFERSRQLLERVLDDERGVTLGAVRRLPAEVFEIAVPLRVFGVVGVGVAGEGGNAEEGEGMVI